LTIRRVSDVAPALHREPWAAEGPLALDRPDTIDRLRVALRSVGYSGESVRELLGDDAYQARARDVPVQLLRLTARTPVETAIKLFFLCVPVAVDELESALAPLSAAELEELRVVQRAERDVHATVRLVPHMELLLAGNRYPDENPDGTPADYVATVTAPSAILAALTVRTAVRMALDVGTGSGVQAIWAARHCERVVAVDVNRRALNIAAFNARLNGIENIELREGSLFEPVAGERFDLILCNAPYVISPDTRYAFRDGGLPSDGFSERLVRETPEHLEEGAFAHLLIGWLLKGDDWAARPRSWIEDSGCDAWLLQGVSRDPVTHASVWNDELAGDRKAYANTLERWVAYMRELGADAVIEGALVLRRRSGVRNWFRADRIPQGQPSPASDHVRRVFDARDHLTALADDDALLDESPRVVERVRVEQELSLAAGGYVVESMTLVLEEGLGFRAGIDQNTASLVPFLDGTRTLRDAIDSAARARGVDVDDHPAFIRGALELVKTMLELGFLDRGRDNSATSSRH
jgi:methylase of polypeptide subunit release factors